MSIAADASASRQGEPSARNQGEALRRLLKPRTIAVVGLSDKSSFLDYIAPSLDSDAEVFFVNPKYDTVLGRKTYARIQDIGRPIDAVLSVMSAERTTQLAEDCADLDCGGLVLIAGGFAETGAEGAALQTRLVAAAERGGMAVIGPNGLGYINVPHQVSLTIASRHKRRPGGISIVSQSGAMLSGVAMAAWDRPGTGLNVLISAGNEAVTDLADYIDYFADDPETEVIGLVIEQVRRPEAFFAAVRKATAAGKPVAALKLARSSRTQAMAASHTNALTGDAWVYDVAFAQAGIAMARDPEELVDRLSMFPQLDADRWTGVRNLGIITMTGGFASLSYDIAEAEGLEVPALESMKPWVMENLPGVTVPNPLDTTGLGSAFWPQIVDSYANSPELDALLYIHPLADEDDSPTTRGLVAEFIKAAREVRKPFVIANCSGPLGDFVDEQVRGTGVVALGHGLRSTLRGLATLGGFARRQAATVLASGAVTPAPRPAAAPVRIAEGPMLPFGATMDLIASYGIPTAPHVLIEEGAPVAVPDFAGPYVVKLADVGHRTEHGAVRLKVTGETLAGAVAEMRDIAARDGLPALVAVQPMADIQGETIVGVQGGSELGPLVVFGIGGVLVEVVRRVGGRMAPLTPAEARGLIEEFADLGLMHGFRGSEPWDLDALTEILVGAGRLAAEGADWIASLDINPLVYGSQGFVAVDALCLLRP
ncbi:MULTISPECIES: acetate--CoA ligase family protein [unclassified Streptomyces]|uniref:acetate--CoA ligase family protein n=1 Tax=unclassified Streptomyces TaxID=2593676 RepID=UPI002E2B9FE4|nr:acetate--CoA ligase family protein [Streptomyces sp. NBC_00223]